MKRTVFAAMDFSGLTPGLYSLRGRVHRECLAMANTFPDRAADGRGVLALWHHMLVANEQREKKARGLLKHYYRLCAEWWRTSGPFDFHRRGPDVLVRVAR